MSSWRRLVALAPVMLVPAMLLGACAGGRQDAYGAAAYRGAPAAPMAFAAWSDDDYRYRIGAGDELALRFVVNPDLNANVIVGPDGRGVFPLVGEVRLDGLTVAEAGRTLTQAYGRVLRNPQVETLVAGYGSAQIYVGGEVKEPGVKIIKGQLTLAQAVMAAGGFSDEARGGQVAVLRQGPGEARPHLRVVDVRGVLRGKAGDGDVRVQPGDVVFVPRSQIGEVDLFVKQYLTDLVPFGISYGVAANARF